VGRPTRLPTSDLKKVKRMRSESASGHPTRRRRGLRRPRATGLARSLRLGIWSILIAALFGGGALVTFAIATGGWTMAPILSGSMRPGFPVGGVVVAEREPMASLAVGDVILFQNPNQPSVEMVHRITQLQIGQSGQPVVKTKGDANSAADPWAVTLKGRTVYVAEFTLPLLGYLAVGTNHGVDLMIGGVILLLVMVSIVLGMDRKPQEQRSRPDLRAPWPPPMVPQRVADRTAGTLLEPAVTLSGRSRGSSPQDTRERIARLVSEVNRESWR